MPHERNARPGDRPDLRQNFSATFRFHSVRPGRNQTLRIPQGAKVTVRVRNDGDGPTTVHWHGLRLDNRFDGTHATQAPIPVGGTFAYELRVPDAGGYWYHPHIREDHGQEMGLYGTIVVTPSERDYWPAADRELALTVDDLLIEDGQVYLRSTATLRIAARLTFPWSLARYALVIPAPIRDAAYRVVAAIRHRLAGKSNACEVPPPAIRARMI
jgi:FtsP/CotA-like multicopper oxidase with cupredoxin domain